MTYADILRPQAQRQAWLYDLVLVLSFSFIIAALAQVAIPLPFTPVPITGQTLGVLLAGFLLGSRRGAGAVLLYLAEGAAGLPVFAGAKAGMAVFFGPTAGYLLGFVVAAYLVGVLAERDWDRNYALTLGGMVLGNLVIYTFGVSWLAVILGSLTTAITAGLVPFLIGDLIKILLAVGLLPTGWRLLGQTARE